MSPLGKLSFNAYLWHRLMIDWYYASSFEPLQYSRLNMLIMWLGLVYAAFGIALFAYLFVEEPFSKLSTALLKYVENALKAALKGRAPQAQPEMPNIPELEQNLNQSTEVVGQCASGNQVNQGLEEPASLLGNAGHSFEEEVLFRRASV